MRVSVQDEVRMRTKCIKTAVIVLAALLILESFAIADEYKVYVERIENNLYRDSKSGAIIKTSLCFELAYGGQRAILIWYGANHFACGTLFFIENKQSCQVDAVYP
jgi:hypothetical protein